MRWVCAIAIAMMAAGCAGSPSVKNTDAAPGVAVPSDMVPTAPDTGAADPSENERIDVFETRDDPGIASGGRGLNFTQRPAAVEVRVTIWWNGTESDLVLDVAEPGACDRSTVVKRIVPCQDDKHHEVSGTSPLSVVVEAPACDVQCGWDVKYWLDGSTGFEAHLLVEAHYAPPSTS